MQAAKNSADNISSTYLLFGEIFNIAHMIPQIPSPQVFHDQVQILPILKSFVCIDDEAMMKQAQQLFFIDDALNTFLGDHPTLRIVYLAFEICFMAKIFFGLLFYCTFHTLPNPPDPILFRK